MDELKSKRNNIERLKFRDLTMILFVVHMISGNTAVYSLYLGMGLYVIWIFTIWNTLQKSIADKKNKNVIICFSLYLIYIFVVTYPNATLFYTLKQVSAALLLFSPILMYTQFRKQNLMIQKKILWITLFIFLSFCIVSLVAFEGLDINARNLAANRQSYGNIAIGGGYSLAYSAAILSVLFFDLKFKKMVPSFLRWQMSYLMLVLMGFLIYQTKSTITLLSWIVGMIFSVILQPRKIVKDIFRRLTRIIVIVGIGILIINLEIIGLWLVKVTRYSDNTMLFRLSSLGSAMADGLENSNSEYFMDRLLLPLMSLSTFLQNLLFGVALYHGNGYSSSRMYGISQHGEWTDALGNYGLIGGLPFLFIYFYHIKSTMIRSQRCVTPAWCIVIFLIGAFNPIRTFSTHLVIFFLIPALIDIIRKRPIHQ